jgi:hypothetical protein
MRITSVWRFKVEWSWTNWTFGVWYGKFSGRHAIGVDMGPLELIWKQVYVKRPGSRRGGKV